MELKWYEVPSSQEKMWKANIDLGLVGVVEETGASTGLYIAYLLQSINRWRVEIMRTFEFSGDAMDACRDWFIENLDTSAMVSRLEDDGDKWGKEENSEKNSHQVMTLLSERAEMERTIESLKKECSRLEKGILNEDHDE